MKLLFKYNLLFFFILLYPGCGYNKPDFKSPKGYDFSKPEKFDLPKALNEISGIAFNNGNPDIIFAEEDKDGKLFTLSFGGKINKTPDIFRWHDFEDITICRGFIIMLRSDGLLAVLSLKDLSNNNFQNITETNALLPQAEYESLCSLESTGEIFILSKHGNTKKHHIKRGYILKIDNNGNLSSAGNFKLNTKTSELQLNKIQEKFHPSAMAFNSCSKEWFILSAVNHLLMITDSDWNVKDMIDLDPTLFQQPEGIAFDKNCNLYFSNEKNSAEHATILKFAHIK